MIGVLANSTLALSGPVEFQGQFGEEPSGELGRDVGGTSKSSDLHREFHPGLPEKRMMKGGLSLKGPYSVSCKCTNSSAKQRLGSDEPLVLVQLGSILSSVTVLYLESLDLVFSESLTG